MSPHYIYLELLLVTDRIVDGVSSSNVKSSCYVQIRVVNSPLPHLFGDGDPHPSTEGVSNLSGEGDRL